MPCYFQASTEDPLSKYICSVCLKKLSSFVKFREFVFRNDKLQRSCHDVNMLYMSKNATAEKRHIDTENEPHLIKKIKVKWIPEQVESFGISNQPKWSNKDEDKRNSMKENGSATQRVAKSTIQEELQEGSNKEQVEKALPNTIVLKENLMPSDSGVSNGSQTTFDHNHFTLASGYLMEHKLMKGNLR